MGGLERLAAADEDAGLGAAAGPDHDRGRRREPHRARAGDDDDADERGERERDAAAPGPNSEPDDERRRPRATRTSGTKTSAIRSARRWIGALLPWARRDELDDPGERRVAADPRGAHHERAGRVERRADDLGARPDLDRDRLAGQHAGVDRRRALDDDAVDRDLLAGPDPQQVADGDRLERDVLLAAVHRRGARSSAAGRRAAGSRRSCRPLARPPASGPSRTRPMMIVDESK